MIISGYEFRNEKPFSNVYFTGIVRDKLRRKMSKQLGNSPDAIKLIEEYGADSVRVGLMLSSAAGNDLLFDVSLCQQGKNFTNKLWNALKLINGWEIGGGSIRINDIKILKKVSEDLDISESLDQEKRNNYSLSTQIRSHSRLRGSLAILGFPWFSLVFLCFSWFSYAFPWFSIPW